MNNLNLIAASPEIFMAIAIVIVLLADLFVTGKERTVTYVLSLAALAGCAVFTMAEYNSGATTYAFNNMYVSDPLANLLKLFVYLSVAVTLIYSRGYVNDRAMVGQDMLGGEFYMLALFAALGQMIMISSNNMLVVYLGLELNSLALYALVALRRDHSVATEAAMKYFILGALASGFLLYGISMFYGATGTLDLTAIAEVTSAEGADRLILVFGLVFIVAGLAFKLGAVPFHMWVPDVYQGAPTAVTLLLGAAPKLAIFAIVVRVLIEGVPVLAFDWQQMLMVLAVLSMVIGNITAIAQTNVKRMLAYSTISQVGFMLLGLLSGVFEGSDATDAANAYGASLFYMITYVLTTLGSFGVIMLLARTGFEAETLEDFKGLNQRSPWFAAVMMILLLSLAGVPPMVGFYAKLSVLQAVVASGHLWLAIVAVLASLIGAYYYLRVIKMMYFDDATDNATIDVKTDMQITLSANGVAVIALGILPGALMAACVAAMANTLGL